MNRLVAVAVLGSLIILNTACTSIEELPLATPPAPVEKTRYYSDAEISALNQCATIARQAATTPREQLPHAYRSANDYALEQFKSCTKTHEITLERSDRATYCMSGQFFANYIWNAKQRGLTQQQTQQQLSDSPYRAVGIVTRDIYSKDYTTLEQAQEHLWRDCIHSFHQITNP